MAHKTHLFAEMSTVLESCVRKADGGGGFFCLFVTVLIYCFIVKFNGQISGHSVPQY